MGFGILGDPHLGNNVPGTSPLDDLRSKRASNTSLENSYLKRSKDGIVLIPQPSSSPDDPLNWPLWRKTMLMITLTYGAGVVGAFGPIIGAGLTQVAISLNTSVNSFSMMTGDMFLATGLILILTAPASVLWGRRPVFLAGSAVLLVSSIWAAVAKDVGSLVASRVIGGAGMAPLESLVEATIADIFFVHERGTWISLWSFAFLGGISEVYIVNGYLIQNASWRVCFLIEAILCAILFILTIFFVPETVFIRDKVPTEGRTVAVDDQSMTDKTPQPAEKDAERSCDVEVEVLDEQGTRRRRRFSDDNFWKICLRPFTLICSPVVAWGTLTSGSAQAWIVAVSVSISLLFSSPAYGYNFSAGPVGLISGTGALICGILGNLFAGPVSDWSVAWLSRRNGGIYEPEFRLFMMIPAFITSTIGWFGWAISANLRELWIGPAIFYSLLNFSLAVCSVTVVAYVVDAHGNYSAEAFATINFVRNIFIFGLTYFFIPWLNGQGVLRTFCAIGGINIWVCLMSVPMYVYGKRARSWVHRTPWMLT